MRSVSVFILTGCLGWALVGCQKESDTDCNPGSELVLGQQKTGSDLQWKRDDSGNGNHQCPPNGNRCTKFTALPQADDDDITEVFSAINTGDPTTISNAFREHEVVLSKYLPASLVDDVIAGYTYPTALTNSANGERFMVFGPSNDETAYNFPR